MDKKKFNIGDWVIGSPYWVWHFNESKGVISGRVIKTTHPDDLGNPKLYLISQRSTGLEYWCRVENLELDKTGERDEKLRKLLDDER